MYFSFLLNIVLAIFALAALVAFIKKNREIANIKKIKSEYKNKISDLESDLSLESEIKEDEVKFAALVEEIDQIRKEKEEEITLRLETEKEIQLALQKTEDVEQRIDDWKVIQEANMEDSVSAMRNIGHELLEELMLSHKNESENLRHSVEETVRNVYEYLEKIARQVQFLNAHNVDGHKAVSAAIGIHYNQDAVNINQHSKNLENILKSAHCEPGIDYFMRYKFSDEAKKSVLCEALFVVENDDLLIVDIRAIRFFVQYFAAVHKKDPAAKKTLKEKMDRYFSYLTNPKYRNNIVGYFAKQGIVKRDAQSSIIMLLPGSRDVKLFSSLGVKYQRALEEHDISVVSMREFSNLVLDINEERNK